MKKLSLLLTLVTITSLLLSSCSRLENISVTKRQHRSGYYVDFGSRKDAKKYNNSKTALKTSVEKQETAAVQEPTESTTDVVASPSNISENVNTVSAVKETATTNPSALVYRAEKKKQVAKEKTDKLFASTNDNSVVQEMAKSENVKKRTRSFSEVLDVVKSPSSSEDVPFWALVLFAILLPPLAIYLKFGMGNEFWISVILTLLLWIPGVVYALIMILKD